MARGQGQKKSETKDNPSEDRPSLGQGQECLRPRTLTQVFSKKKNNVFKYFFSGDLRKKSLQKSFSGDLQKTRSTKNFFKRYTKF